MKLLIYTISGVALLAPGAAYALAVGGGTQINLCYTGSQCADLINCDVADKCCCPNGNTYTTYNCPSGWTWDSSDGRCERTNTSSSNTYGYYTISYGTCSYTSTTVGDCYNAPVLKSSIETGTVNTCYCPCSSIS